MLQSESEGTLEVISNPLILQIRKVRPRVDLLEGNTAMHLAEPGSDPRMPESQCQAPSHSVTAVTSVGQGLGLAAAPVPQARGASLLGEGVLGRDLSPPQKQSLTLEGQFINQLSSRSVSFESVVNQLFYHPSPL